MLNSSLGITELKKAASKRRVETIRRNLSTVLYTGASKDSADDEKKEKEPNLLTTYTGSKHEVLSLSVFSRPQKPTEAQLAYTNKEFDDNYKYQSLKSTHNLFDPKAALEGRKVMMQAQLEALKALKKAPKSVEKKPPAAKKGKQAPEPEEKAPEPADPRSKIRVLKEL